MKYEIVKNSETSLMLRNCFQMFIFNQIFASLHILATVGKGLGKAEPIYFRNILFAFPTSLSSTQKDYKHPFAENIRRTQLLSLPLESASNIPNPENSECTNKTDFVSRIALDLSNQNKRPTNVGALAWQRPGQPLPREDSGRRRNSRNSAVSSSSGPRSNRAQGTVRAEIVVGARVTVVKKEDQRTGKMTEGEVMRLLTNSPFHPRGIKVTS